MKWTDAFINDTLKHVPMGRYRRRAEAELRDHLETEYRALMEAGRTEDEARTETLRVMGKPEKLKEEYEEAWRQSIPAQLEELGRRVGAWVGGCFVMALTHFLAFLFLFLLRQAAARLPSVSLNPQIKMIQDAVENLNSIFFTFFPLLLALIAGAFYLRYKFQASRHPVWPITACLSCHWASVTVRHVWVYTLFEPHLPLEEAATHYFGLNFGYYSFTFLLCVLLGVVFGMIPAKAGKPAAG